MKFLRVELEDRIEITVENDWDLGLASDLADAIEDATHSGAGGKSALRRQLIHNSIGERIRKRQSELEHIGAGFFQRHRKFGGALQSRITRANVGNEALALFLAQAREAIVDPVVHQTE